MNLKPIALLLCGLVLTACGTSSPVGTAPVAGDGSTNGGNRNEPPAAAVSHIRAGVGVVDMTPDVGYCAGPYCEYAPDTLGGSLNGARSEARRVGEGGVRPVCSRW